MKQAYFVTGTDTNVGKTLIASGLLRAFADSGMRAVGMKPVAAGCEEVGGILHCADVTSLLAAGNIAAALSVVNPYALIPPIAPHLAAELAGVEIRLEEIVRCFRELQKTADVVVVEGVGGFMVPLNPRQDTADLAQLLDLPVILVVGLRLGCLNHALLTAEAIKRRGLRLAGWVANLIEPDLPFVEANISALEQRLPAPLLGAVPYCTEANAIVTAGLLRILSLENTPP